MHRWCRHLLAIALALVTTTSYGDAHEGHTHREPPWQKATEWPDRVVATIPGDPSRSFAVCWRTSATVDTAIAQIAPATADARFDLAATTSTAKTQKVHLDEVCREQSNLAVLQNRDLPPVCYHTVIFEELEPNTLYAYRVRGSEGKFSPWRQLRTAPIAGPVSFLVFGDSQTAIRSHITRIFDTASIVASDARFAIHAGDLVNTAMYDKEWAEWFEAVGRTHVLIPILPVAGNHDYMNFSASKLFASPDKTVSPLWRPQFELPIVGELPVDLRETVYDIRYTKDLHIFVLDSSGVAFDQQLRWLDDQVEASTAKWRILTMHHPLFSFVGGNEHPSHRERRLQLLKTLRTHDIDLVLCGHRHTYQRGEFREEGGRFAIGQPHQVQTVFVVTASSTKRGETKTEGWQRYSEEQDGRIRLSRYADNTPLFATVNIDGNTLEFRAYDAIGGVYDAFTLDKSDRVQGPGKKRLTDGPEAAGPTRTYENTSPYRSWDDLRQ